MSQELWEARKGQAIELGKTWVRRMLQDYRDPDRAGTSKGAEVGLSRVKKRAAWLSILDPTVSVKERATMVPGVSYAVLSVWRSSHESFQKEEAEACRIFGEIISNTVQIGVEGITDEKLKPKPYLTLSGFPGSEHPHVLLLWLIPFFNPAVLNPVLHFINRKVAVNDLRWPLFFFELMEAIYLHRHKDMKNWKKSSMATTALKWQANLLTIFALESLKANQKHGESTQESMEIVVRLKGLLFKGIDSIANT